MKWLCSVALCVLALVATIQNSQATLFRYTANLAGTNEVPPNASPGTGFAMIDYDDAAHTLSVDVTFSDLVAGVTAAHIHAPIIPETGIAAVATTTPTFPGFPSGVTAGAYSRVLDLTLATSFNANFIAANGGLPGSAEDALAQYIADGKAYFNIHTTTFPGGEIRGLLVPKTVPEPLTFLLLGLGLFGIVGVRRLKK